MMNDVGRFRELPLWRKEFKAAWKKAMKTPITLPLNERYRPNPYRFICTCPQFVISRFLICKHLVQAFHPVHPIFFLQVTRNRTAPFWSHPSLIPIDKTGTIEPISGPTKEQGACETAMSRDNESEEEEEEEEEEENSGLVDTVADGHSVARESFAEKMRSHVDQIRNFCDGMEHQIQFGDHRFLKTLEREGAGFLRLAETCITQERQLNSSRAASPTTWDNSAANAMFYRSRPRPSEQGT
jgi:hypothetical protein